MVVGATTYIGCSNNQQKSFRWSKGNMLCFLLECGGKFTALHRKNISYALQYLVVLACSFGYFPRILQHWVIILIQIVEVVI